MPVKNVKNLILFPVLCLILAGCSKSDDQRRFEDEAITEPRGITETNATGEIISEDPGDWNISPMHQGLIVVEQPAFPNPVDFNSYFTIQINLRVLDAVNQMTFWAFRFPNRINNTGVELDPSRIQWYNTITIPASSIAEGVTGVSVTYRILVYDGRDNLITYGDVRIR